MAKVQKANIFVKSHFERGVIKFREPLPNNKTNQTNIFCVFFEIFEKKNNGTEYGTHFSCSTLEYGSILCQS